MPYVSPAQRGYMHVHLPAIARRWDREERSMSSPYKKRSRKKMAGVPYAGAIQRRLSGGGTRSIPELSGPKMTMPSGRTINKPTTPAGPATPMPRAPRKAAPLGPGTSKPMDGATPLARAVSRRLRGISAAKKGMGAARARQLPPKSS